MFAAFRNDRDWLDKGVGACLAPLVALDKCLSKKTRMISSHLNREVAKLTSKGGGGGGGGVALLVSGNVF